MSRHRITRLGGRSIPVVAAAMLLTVASAALPAQETSDWTAARVADGQPDISGVWDFRTLTPLERPKDQEATIDEARPAEIEAAAVERARPQEAEAAAATGGGSG